MRVSSPRFSASRNELVSSGKKSKRDLADDSVASNNELANTQLVFKHNERQVNKQKYVLHTFKQPSCSVVRLQPNNGFLLSSNCFQASVVIVVLVCKDDFTKPNVYHRVLHFLALKTGKNT